MATVVAGATVGRLIRCSFNNHATSGASLRSFGMNRNIVLACWVLPLTATVACYAATPPRPTTVALPALLDAATITTHSKVVFENQAVAKQASHCPQGASVGAAGCTVTHYSETERVKQTKTTASYGDTPITYAQFKVLTDPDYNAKLVALERARSRCNGGSLPRWAGIGLAVAGLIVASSSDRTTKILGFAGMGAGAATYTFGYIRYAGPCNQANDLYYQVDFSQDIDRRVVEGDDRAHEMQALSEQFNARRTGAPVAAAGN